MSPGPLRLRSCASLIALIGMLAPGVAHAVPIGVRAKTRVELEHRRAPTGLVLMGRLLDDTGDAVPSERITLELADLPPVTRLTDQGGRFEVPLTSREVSRLRRDGDLVTWSVHFDGNSRLGDVAAAGTLDLAKRATRLEVKVAMPTADPAVPASSRGASVVLGERPVEITVALSDVSEAAPQPVAQAQIALEIGNGSQLVGATGRSGAATFIVRPASFSGGGRYRIKARFEGDSMHAPGRAETELTVVLPTRVTLRVVREGDEVQGRYRMSGRVSDEARPLAGQVVAILAELEQDGAASPGLAAPASATAFELVAATDADGVFVTALPASDLQALQERYGRERVRLQVRARFSPADGLHATAESASVVLEIPPPPGVPLRWYLLGLALVVGFIALTQALRSGGLARALAKVRDAIRRLRERLFAHPPEAPPAGREPLFVTPLQTVNPALSGRGDRLSGVVVDAHTRAPLLGIVSARSRADHARVDADAAGRFVLGPLAPGAWSVTVEAPGHLPRELAVEVPHDGTYDGAQWALVAVHRTVREIFAGTLRGLGSPLAWGYATPREASQSALRNASPPQPGRPSIEPPLDELTRIVEHTHFAEQAGTIADVERALSLRDTLADRPAEGPK